MERERCSREAFFEMVQTGACSLLGHATEQRGWRGPPGKARASWGEASGQGRWKGSGSHVGTPPWQEGSGR